MRKWVLPSLLAALLLAVVLRLQPLLRFELWGSDTGEYYTLIKGIVDRGFISTAYWGWGLGYPYFPGAEVLVGATSVVTGLDIFTMLRLVLPVLGSCTTVVAFMIGWTAFRDERVGLIAAGVVAVAMPHVFATSHPMPGTLGDLLAALCILLYLKVYENRMALAPLMLITLALVPTHHLSAFFVLAPLMFITFVREIIRSKPHPVMMRVDYFYLGFLLAANLVYWLGVAVPFREEVMVDAFGVSAFVVVGGAIGLIALAGLVIVARRKFLKFRYSPKLPSLDRCLLFLGMNFAGILAWMAITAFVQVPGTNVTVPPGQVAYLLPICFIFSLAVVGINAGEFGKRGLFVWLWFISILLLLLLGIFTKNTVLVPYRMFEYIALPIGVLAGWGIAYMAELSFDRGPDAGKGKRMVLAIGITALLMAGAVTAYPPRDLLGGFEEGTTANELGTVAWIGQEVPVRGTLVASDHRMSSIVFGFSNINATWEESFSVLHDDLNGSRSQLVRVKVASGRQRIDYVLIDDAIKDGVALKQWENAEPMSKQSLAKFRQPPFQKVYESNGAELYFVGTMA